MAKHESEKKERFILPKWLIIAVGAACVLIATFAWVVPSLQRYFSAYPQAVRLFRAGQFSEAITRFERALDSSEESERPKVYYMIARSHRGQAPPNLDKAIEYYRTVYEKYPRSYLADDAKAWVGHCECQRNNFEKAIELYSDLMENPIGNGDECDRWEDIRTATVQLILKNRGLLKMGRDEVVEDFRARKLSSEEKDLVWGLLNRERNLEVLYLFNFYEDYLQKHDKDYEVMYKYYKNLLARGMATEAYAAKENIQGEYRMQAEIVDIKNDYSAGHYAGVIKKIDEWLEKFETLDAEVTANMYYIRGSCFMKLGDVQGAVANLLEVTDSAYSREYPGKKLAKETIFYLLQDVPLSEIEKVEEKLDLSRYGKRLISLCRSWHCWQEFDYDSLNRVLREAIRSPSFNDYDKFERAAILLEAEIVNLIVSRTQLVENRQEVERLIVREIQALRHYLLEAAKAKSKIYSSGFRIDRTPDVEMSLAWSTQVVQEYALRGDVQMIHRIISDPASQSVVDLLKRLYLKKPPSPIVKDLLYGSGIASLPSHLYDLVAGTLEQRWERNEYHLLKNRAIMSFLRILALTYLKHENLEELVEASLLFHCEFLGQAILSSFTRGLELEPLPMEVRYNNLSRAKDLFLKYLQESHIKTIDPTLDKMYLENLVFQYLGRIESTIIGL